MARVPRVVISALMPTTVTDSPFTMPMMSVPTTATANAETICRLPDHGTSVPPEPGMSAATAMSIPTNPAADPTDRSN